MPEIQTITEVLSCGLDEAIAISAPEQTSLTYKDFRSLTEKTVKTLNSCDIGRNDRVAIVLPNGPEMASAFISIAAGATTAPLNPSYQKKEFDFYLSDLNAKALLVEQGSTSPALEAAAELKIPILELKKQEKAGLFEIQPGQGVEQRDFPSSVNYAESGDIALVLHTSGTTSQPKIVPLTHTNVCATAQNIQDTLSLTAEDKCMNIMPLFHIHGLMAATLSSLYAGGSVFCTPGFNALKFFAWLKEANPTWYTTVPTMHQTIIARSNRNQDIIDGIALRFIRSSSSSLAPQVMSELEKTFDAPVIESYGMTEAAHQMTSNLLPPYKRKPGTVGVASGPKVSIMNESGELQPIGTTGEVVIQGSNVTLGYESNPKANTENFINGWFRTGDQGVIDEEGYLTITGRLKEIINRGGEKISPREVDEVLMDHPAVQQITTFALPHDKLGEEVAAVVVLREGEEATERNLRDFAGTRLANFKVPRKIIFMDEIPKGATGKPQRIGMAEKLGLV